MTDQRDPEEVLYQRARARVVRRRDFYIHAAVYAIVNLSLAVYSLVTVPGDRDFLITAAGWGIGLVAHGIWALGSGHLPGAGWEERRIQQEMERERRRSRRQG